MSNRDVVEIEVGEKRTLARVPGKVHSVPGFRTTVHFITGGIRGALDRAREAAGDQDIKTGGGVSTVRQYLEAGLIDELHFAIAPVVPGKAKPCSRDWIYLPSASR